MYFIIVFLLIATTSCNQDYEPKCDSCDLAISSDLPKNDDGVYELTYNENLNMTYSHLYAETNCGWSKRIMWDSNVQFQLSSVDWTNLINPSSMTDEDGNGTIVFGVWEEHIGQTITFYGGYSDDCDNIHLDSIKVKVL